MNEAKHNPIVIEVGDHDAMSAHICIHTLIAVPYLHMLNVLEMELCGTVHLYDVAEIGIASEEAAETLGSRWMR